MNNVRLFRCTIRGLEIEDVNFQEYATDDHFPEDQIDLVLNWFNYSAAGTIRLSNTVIAVRL